MKFRKGDVRHCIADNSKLHDLLGFVPQTAIEDGLKEVIEWSGTTHAEDRFDEVTREWKEKGLV
jgi:dTDP-L-rhamnose 4-epimerase